MLRSYRMRSMEDKLHQAIKNRAEIAEIQRKYKTGEITREQAKQLAEPVISRINEATIIKTKELNKKYDMNRKPALVDFINLMRNSY
jgi:Asp-tRNA(Asn)/Glu-tRNA(Gln) amidotransferase B subunit